MNKCSRRSIKDRIEKRNCFLDSRLIYSLLVSRELNRKWRIAVYLRVGFNIDK